MWRVGSRHASYERITLSAIWLRLTIIAASLSVQTCAAGAFSSHAAAAPPYFYRPASDAEDGYERSEEAYIAGPRASARSRDSEEVFYPRRGVGADAARPYGTSAAEYRQRHHTPLRSVSLPSYRSPVGHARHQQRSHGVPSLSSVAVRPSSFMETGRHLQRTFHRMPMYPQQAADSENSRQGVSGAQFSSAPMATSTGEEFAEQSLPFAGISSQAAEPVYPTGEAVGAGGDEDEFDRDVVMPRQTKYLAGVGESGASVLQTAMQRAELSPTGILRTRRDSDDPAQMMHMQPRQLHNGYADAYGDASANDQEYLPEETQPIEYNAREMLPQDYGTAGYAPRQENIPGPDGYDDEGAT